MLGAAVALLATAESGKEYGDAVQYARRYAELLTAAQEDGRDVTRTVYLAFLAPDIVDCIIRGEQPIGLGVRRLLAMAPLPMDWVEQRKVLGLA